MNNCFLSVGPYYGRQRLVVIVNLILIVVVVFQFEIAQQRKMIGRISMAWRTILSNFVAMWEHQTIVHLEKGKTYKNFVHRRHRPQSHLIITLNLSCE